MVETMADRAVNVAGGLVREATKRFISLQDEKGSAKEEGKTLANQKRDGATEG